MKFPLKRMEKMATVTSPLVDYPTVLPEHMTFQKCIEESENALDLFFNNKFDAAEAVVTPWKKASIYHAMGSASFKFMRAVFTFEKEDFQTSSAELDSALEVCERNRKQFNIIQSIGNAITKTNYDEFSEFQVHAELIYAECLLLRSVITFLEDETLSSFIKGGIRLRSSFNTYKECNEILKISKWSDWPSKPHFESGTKTGIGSFNLIISLLPPRIVKLLEFIGFSGDKAVGLLNLEEGSQIEGLRQTLCILALLLYNLYIKFMMTYSSGDYELCEKLLKAQLKKYPEGVWFLILKGRLEFMKGNFSSAVDWFTKSWKSQNRYPHINNFCYWEILWIYCMQRDWNNAATFAQNLIDKSKWSMSIYCYQKAAILLMMPDKLKYKEEIDKLMKEVPVHYHRIAGKHIPSEKFVVQRSERYFKQNCNLVLPMAEILFLWNFFRLLNFNKSIGELYLKEAQSLLKEYDVPVPISTYDNDNKALLLLLSGTYQRNLGFLNEATNSLKAAIALEKELKDDTFITPYALVELGYTLWEQKQKSEAIETLESAKKNYTGYHLESRLHFRIQSAVMEFKEKVINQDL